MKKLLLILTVLTIFITVFSSSVSAQEMMGNRTSSPSGVVSDEHTARKEVEGKEIQDKLQAKEVTCDNLSDENFGALGEYFMGLSIGNTERHAVMNQMMISMTGEEGEKQMHVAMGKRLSGCEPNAQIPANGAGFMPMMWMMGGGGNSMMGYGGWGGFGLFGWIFMIIFWVLLILGIVVLIRHLGDSTRSRETGKSSLDILKERYAKGEIDKKEFEEKKKDLG